MSPRASGANEGNELFKEVADELGLADQRDGRGLAMADFDNDGDLDVYISNQGQDGVLYRNDLGNRNHWLQVELTGTNCNRNAIGSRITVVCGRLSQIRELDGGNGDHSQCSHRLHFGLGQQEKVERLEIRWPTGYVERFEDVAADQRVQYTERTSAAFLEERKQFKEAQLEARRKEVEREKRLAAAAASATEEEPPLEWNELEAFKKEYLKHKAAVEQDPTTRGCATSLPWYWTAAGDGPRPCASLRRRLSSIRTRCCIPTRTGCWSAVTGTCTLIARSVSSRT